MLDMSYFILLIASSSLLVQEISGQAPGFQIGNGGVRFRLNCDMVLGPDIAAQAGPGEKCGDFCNANGGCAVFTWTGFNGGTCFMKGFNWVRFQDGLQGAVCGYIPGRVADNDGRLPGGGGGGGIVQATYWNEQSDAGGCQMPQNNANYVITDALALGQSTALGNLAFRSGLCGQVLTVNCGHGAVDAVVASTCNIGSSSCGVDLIGKTWRKLTNNQSPGIAQCSVTLSNRNPIAGNAPLCYRRPNSDNNNLFFVALGVLNTSGRVSKSATLAGVNGNRGGGDQWFLFNSNNGLFNGGASVIFQFEDGSSANFRLQDCIVSGDTHIFNSA